MPDSDGFNQLKQCRHGMLLYNSLDIYIGRSLELYGEYCEGEADLFRQIVQKDMVAVEVGANIGVHTVLLAKLVGKAGRIIAFEPQRIAFQTLCANMALNSLTNVYCRQEALGAEAGEIIVPSISYQEPNNFGGVALGSHTSGEMVPLVTIDALNLTDCHFIKIDVEGMELQVIQGAIQTVTRSQPILYVENDRRENSAELIRFLDHLGYDMYWHTPPLYNPSNFAANPENVFGTVSSINMLCCHKSIPQRLTGFQSVAVSTAA